MDYIIMLTEGKELEFIHFLGFHGETKVMNDGILYDSIYDYIVQHNLDGYILFKEVED